MTVALKINLQLVTEPGFGEPRVLNAGTILRVAADQTGVESGMIRLHHPAGFPVVINRKHCTEPRDPAGLPIPLLYSAAEHARLTPTTLKELRLWDRKLGAMLSDALTPNKATTGR